jgi:hypothetical protein
MQYLIALLLVFIVTTTLQQEVDPVQCAAVDNCNLQGRCVPDTNKGGVLCECFYGYIGTPRCSNGPPILEPNEPQNAVAPGGKVVQ